LIEASCKLQGAFFMQRNGGETMVRCKFKCTQKTETTGGFQVTLEPVTCGSQENEQFFKWTPWGKMEFGTINEEAAKQFEVGKEYFIDLSPAL
jgi:hypothetical protein